MDFSVDKENKKIAVKREFAATVAKVWNAWTTPELLEQWWAPKPWQAKSKHMDFVEGGYWLYAMVGPEGEEHWARADYKKIIPQTEFIGLDAFCDSEGVINPSFPQNTWNVRFSSQENTTLVEVTMTFDKLEDLEATIQMGFKEGFTMALENLDTVLNN